MNLPISMACTVALLVLTTAGAQAWAGADNADLSCKGKQKGTAVTLVGRIPGDFAEFTLTLTVDGAGRAWSDDKEDIVVVTDFERKVLTFVVLLEYGRPQLYAIPSTMKVKRTIHGRVDATFEAVLKGAPAPTGNPQKYDAPLPSVRLRCTYHYSV